MEFRTTLQLYSLTVCGQKPPATYAEWLNCFSAMENGKVTRGELQLLRSGSFPPGQRLPSLFTQRLAQAVSAILNREFCRTARKVEEACAENDMEYVYTLFLRLRKTMNECQFLSELPFLPSVVQDELRQSMIEQVCIVWNELLNKLKHSMGENHSAARTDVLYRVRKIKLFRK